MESQSLIKKKRDRKNGDYGSISYSSNEQRVRDFTDVAYRRLDDSNEEEVVQIRFVYRKRDAVMLGILLVLVVASVMATLLVGIPKIRAKNALMILNNNSTEAKVLPDITPVVAVVYPNKSDANFFTNAAVSTNCPQCSTIAARVLEQNGSAVDAAIAATICLSVVDSHHTGLAGGFFMTIYNRGSKTSEVIDARETAPAAAHSDMFQSNRTLASIGGLSVAVPGILKGLWVAHRSYGRLSWSQLVLPSVELCEDGFEVGTSLALALQSEKNAILGSNLRSVFVNEATGDVWKKGEVIRQPVLGRTLRVLAERGADEFYSGQMATDLVKDIQSLDGIVSLDDLKNYQVKVKKAVNVSLKGGLQLYSVPPPGSGALVAFFLSVLEDFNVSMRSWDDTALTYHRVIEAMKFMYARRESMADPDYVDTQQALDALLDKKYAKMIKSQIKDDTTFESEYYLMEGEAGVWSPQDKGTSHVSVIAPDGDAVSVTSTINQKFGAQVMSPSTGLVLNNEMDDFSTDNLTNYFGIPPFEDNFVEAGKRPVSSMCPSIVVDGNGDVVLVSGSAGGIRITSSVAYTIWRYLWLNESIVEATDQPRMHHLFVNRNVLEIENRMPQPVLDRLKRLGHILMVVKRSGSIVNSVSASRIGQMEAVGDRRGDARVDGF